MISLHPFNSGQPNARVHVHFSKGILGVPAVKPTGPVGNGDVASGITVHRVGGYNGIAAALVLRHSSFLAAKLMHLVLAFLLTCCVLRCQCLAGNLVHSLFPVIACKLPLGLEFPHDGNNGGYIGIGMYPGQLAIVYLIAMYPGHTYIGPNARETYIFC
ncbi:hypothetical protein B0H12DRAFT_1080426 [Mycena haematopus]|nr:hypothetical protein B0H12DRAFT_1080426 [Mycena haematopus]